MNLTRTDIDTKGYESLLSLVENTTNDSFDLYYGLFLYNPNATQVSLEGRCLLSSHSSMVITASHTLPLSRSLTPSFARRWPAGTGEIGAGV